MKDPINIKIISDTKNDHCDLYPAGSYHKGHETVGGFKPLGLDDCINFKYQVTEFPENAKSCPDCGNVFDSDEPFVEGICIRSWERKHLTGDRDAYHDAMRRKVKMDSNEKVSRSLDLLLNSKERPADISFYDEYAVEFACILADIASDRKRTYPRGKIYKSGKLNATTIMKLVDMGAIVSYLGYPFGTEIRY